MGTHKDQSPILYKQSDGIQLNKGRVDLVKSDFDKLVYQKGYDVLIDRALKCPCRNKPDSQALSSCKNCGGSGWVFFNRESSKIVFQSMNKDTRYKEWSEENLGIAKLTAPQELKLSFMDRITLTSGFAIHSQVTHCILHEDKIKAKLIYVPLEITEIYLFKGPNEKLQLLEHEIDFTVNNNIIILNDSYISLHSEENPLTISIRYSHYPQFHILDLPRETISSYNKANNQILPINAIARRAHYVIDEQNYGVNWLFDNDYTAKCSIYKASKDITTILRKIINTDNTDQTLEELLASGAFLTIVDPNSTQQDLLELYIVDQIDDETSDSIIYIGKQKNDQSGKWLIEKIVVIDNGDEESIEISYFNDDSVNNYEISWNDRENLSYILSENLQNL